jgi:CheY-like chemotaxis protein
MRDKRILLVEDDPDDAELTRLAVSEAAPGCAWTVARDGVEALARLRAGAPRPDLVILDLNMPRVDGLELLERLAAEWGPGLRGLRIVVLSTSNEERDRRAAARLGVAGYLRKPISREESGRVARAIAELLEREE